MQWGATACFKLERSVGKYVAHLHPAVWAGWKTVITIKRLQMFSFKRWIVHYAIKRRGSRHHVTGFVLAHFHIRNGIATNHVRPSSFAWPSLILPLAHQVGSASRKADGLGS